MERGDFFMQLTGLKIRNFKSIRDLEITDAENALILVGKNNTGKSGIMDAIRAAMGGYPVLPENFNEKKQNIEIGMTLRFTDEDLHFFHEHSIVSSYKRYDSWRNDFSGKLPSFQDGLLSFDCVINRNGTVRYQDGFHKHNRYIPRILPRIYVIGSEGDLQSFQEDLLLDHDNAGYSRLRHNRCMFDAGRVCSHCFECIGLICQKQPADLDIQETARLLEYKMVQTDLQDFADRVNANYHKNGGMETIRYCLSARPEELFHMDTEVSCASYLPSGGLGHLSKGMKSIYMLSLLETYAEDDRQLPCILLIDYPELFLHPSLQKTAGEILYRLSRKNQLIFTTHSPALISCFTQKQLHQVQLDEEGFTVIRSNVEVDRILEDLGYNAVDVLNVDFVFFVEGKQDRSRLPLLLRKYYPELQNPDGSLSRISIISTNSCTNIRTYANLKYMNQLYIRDQFLMIRDGDGKDPEQLTRQLTRYYADRNAQDEGTLPDVRQTNVKILRYYSFENYFLNPAVMVRLGIIKTENSFWQILYARWQSYLKNLSCAGRLREVLGHDIRSIRELKDCFETFKIYMRGHNLFDIFYGRFRSEEEELLTRYIELAPREDFADILDTIDRFPYFESRRRQEEEDIQKKRSEGRPPEERA